MSEVITPNMNLIQPAIGNTPSPTWASDLNADMSSIDSHDHSSGKGVSITPDGINISADLPFNSNNATLLRSARFATQTVPLALGSDLICAYAVGTAGDLYWNDNNGNQIQITASGGIAGSPGSIANLTSPAAATWVSADATFVWTRASNVAANMDAGTLIVRYPGSYPAPSGNYIAIQAPTTLSSGYAITLPALPGSQSFLTIDASGNLVAPSSFLGGITRTNLAPVGQQISSSSGAYSSTNASFTDVTNLSITLTTSGRPVWVGLIPDGGSTGAGIEVLEGVGSSSTIGYIKILRDATIVGISVVQNSVSPSASYGLVVPPGSVWSIDPVSAGTYTYKIQARVADGTDTVRVTQVKLVAYEL